MSMLKTIFRRRSIRKFKEVPLQEEEISMMLKSAMAAPSANNLKAWHFMVIDKRELLDQLADIHPYGKMLKQAPAAILVCGDIQKQAVMGYLALDCTAATQNILLAATAMKIGSVWLGVYPREQRMDAISKQLKLPEHIRPISLIALGFADENKPANNPWTPEVIHNNKW
ncbi:MAG: nitroreductase family protein [Bacteroidetes bacterium]|nr:nitroreductase family protein [Bacteroidota bacterium]